MARGRDNSSVRAGPATFLLWRFGAGTIGCVALLLLWGCREHEAQISLPRLPEVRDASAPRPPVPKGAIECADDADCDDGIDCTRDVCIAGTYCSNAADNSSCADRIYCNGVEVCEPGVGCRPGQPLRCNDESVCTIDSCDEDEKRCKHTPRDFDGDGEVDWHCLGGTDCDDFDSTRATTAREVCGDGLDNDCDDRIDETDGCTQPAHDTCEDAIDVGAGGSVMIDLAGAVGDYALKCGALGARDAVFSFEIDEPKDVTLIARGLLSDGTEETAALAVRSDCADVETETECSYGFPALARIRALAPGRYFGIVSSERSAQVVLETHFDPPTEAPTNTSCKKPLDISKGGRFEGDFVDVGDDERVACGFPDANDLVYQFTLEKKRDVELSAISVTGERMNFAVRTTCHDADSTLRCVSDAPARAHMYGVEPGTYYVVIESSPSREVDFSLDAAFLPPSEPPPGNGCTQPVDLPLGTEVDGTLASRQDLVQVISSCDAQDAPAQPCNQFRPDTAYRVKVDKSMDLGVSVNGGASLMAYDFRTTCEDPDSQLAYQEGALVTGRVRNVTPGQYYLIVESPEAANFKLELDPLPRTVPIDVKGNDTCSKAIEIPESGGLFRGDTLTLVDNYQAQCGGGAHSHDAAFHLELSKRSRVTASLEAQFDTVVYRFSDLGGASSCKSQDEAMCNDDSGQGRNSRLSELLDPGAYYYIVDGFNDSNAGNYLFEVTIAPE
jgi:hypothetical protein